MIEHGRNLGGRPPYGYHLVEARPYPNKNHARWGRKALRLEPHPDTAPHVRWIFAQRLAGRSVASIAHDLNVRGIACPSRVMDFARGGSRARVTQRLTDPRFNVPTTVASFRNRLYLPKLLWSTLASLGTARLARAGTRRPPEHREGRGRHGSWRYLVRARTAAGDRPMINW